MEITAASFRSNCFKIPSDPLLGSLPNAGSTVGDLTESFEDEWELD